MVNGEGGDAGDDGGSDVSEKAEGGSAFCVDLPLMMSRLFGLKLGMVLAKTYWPTTPAAVIQDGDITDRMATLPYGGTMNTGFKTLATLMMILFLAGNASADVTNSYSNINDILKENSNFLTIENPEERKSLTGLFDFIYLGSEAGHWNIVNKSGEEIFNKLTDPGETVYNSNIDLLAFVDTSVYNKPSYALDTWTEWVHIYQLAQPVNIAGIVLSKGMFLFGFNDSGSGDGDYDDMLVAAKPVPIPGAALLLGSAILGLVGFRRGRTV